VDGVSRHKCRCGQGQGRAAAYWGEVVQVEGVHEGVLLACWESHQTQRVSADALLYRGVAHDGLHCRRSGGGHEQHTARPVHGGEGAVQRTAGGAHIHRGQRLQVKVQ
jgi:hypothetical protein